MARYDIQMNTYRAVSSDQTERPTYREIISLSAAGSKKGAISQAWEGSPTHWIREVIVYLYKVW